LSFGLLLLEKSLTGQSSGHPTLLSKSAASGMGRGHGEDGCKPQGLGQCFPYLWDVLSCRNVSVYGGRGRGDKTISFPLDIPFFWLSRAEFLLTEKVPQ